MHGKRLGYASELRQLALFPTYPHSISHRLLILILSNLSLPLRKMKASKRTPHIILVSVGREYTIITLIARGQINLQDWTEVSTKSVLVLAES